MIFSPEALAVLVYAALTASGLGGTLLLVLLALDLKNKRTW